MKRSTKYLNGSRKRIPAYVFVVAVLTLVDLAAPRVSAGLPVHTDALVEARIDSLVRVAVDHVYAGRVDLGIKTMDVAVAVAPRDPRIGLTWFRLLRENYPVTVYEKDRAREQENELIGHLDHTITICDSLLELDEHNVVAYLYRGQAYINKAQTELIARRLRDAVSSSRRGVDDLEKFYEYHPQGDPDAATMLGSYLYFADTLSGFYKFIRWIVRVPGGDRERGLELIREGAKGDGYVSRDAVLVLAATYFMFDGNFEDASEMLEAIAKEYPYYPMAVECTSFLSVVYPETVAATLDSESRVLEGWDGAGNPNATTRGWGDAILYDLIWSRARHYRQIGLYEEALSDLEVINKKSPRWPNWVLPNARTAAIELSGKLGRKDAVEFWRGQDDNPEELPDVVINGEKEAAAFSALGRVRNALYTGGVEEAAGLLDKVIAAHGHNVYSEFLRGEVARYSGRFDEALEIYAEIEKWTRQAKISRNPRNKNESKNDPGERDLRIQALVQMGEIHLRSNDYERAEWSYKKAYDVVPRHTMLSNVIRGRLFYIERQKD